ELANKNLKRNSRKARVITASIALSAVLFLSVNYFCELYAQSNELYSYADRPYQVEILFSSSEYEIDDAYKAYENLKKSIMDIPGVKDVFSIDSFWEAFSEKAANPQKGVDHNFVNQDLRKTENLRGSYKNLWEEVRFTVNFVEDDDFNDLCEKNGIDYTKYYEAETGEFTKIKCVVMNNISHKNTGDKVFTDNFIGEEIFYEYNLWPETDEDDNIIGWIDYNADDDPEDVDIVKLIVTDFVEYDDDNYLCHLNAINTISVYVPVSMEKVYSGNDIGIFIALGIVTDNHEYVADEIGKIIDEGEYHGAYVNDVQQYLESEQTRLFVLQVFVYGFIILITMITIANIVNTISTGIDLRRREFAMLKSVGITQKGFIKMICLESLFYGLRALIFAIPLSVLTSYVLYKRIDSNVIPFELNYITYFAVIAAVFAVVGFAMLYSVSKLKKASIIETLKEDIS
ncbi:MAG: ABC transporter permease, partial [Eubacterium sp.]|nr:ABC transporter permease [Eubacterium sp.]